MWVTFFPHDVRMAIVERFIQLMSNSGHKFTFIRSVVQQALTKFHYMLERASYSIKDPRYQPLHRPPDHKATERIMNKYVSGMVWYKPFDLGDEFRQGWKRRLKYRGQKTSTKLQKLGKKYQNHLAAGQINPNLREKLKVETTSALFVPPTMGGRLHKALEEEEEELSRISGWKVKIVEKSGFPLAMLLKPKFPMINGCVLGNECQLCENDGVGCERKNVVYSAECMTCPDISPTLDVLNLTGNHGMGPPNSENTKFIYIGETSRACRTRAKEHMKKAMDMKQDSFINQHWFDIHGTSAVRPEFKFRIIKTCTSALERQITEAIWILSAGNLNSKTEYGLNHLCRLVNETPPFEAEKLHRDQERRNQNRKKDLAQFLKVMLDVEDRCNGLNSCDIAKSNNCVANDKNTYVDVDDNPEYCYRSNKRPNSEQDLVSKCKKYRGMETSTPVKYNTPRVHQSPDVTPPDQQQQLPDTSYLPPQCRSLSFSEQLESDMPANKSPTGASFQLDYVALTPTKRVETSYDRDVGTNALANALLDANILYDVQRREDGGVSLLIDALLDGLNLSEWSSNLSGLSGNHSGETEGVVDNNSNDTSWVVEDEPRENGNTMEDNIENSLGLDILFENSNGLRKNSGPDQALDAMENNAAGGTEPLMTPEKHTPARRRLAFGSNMTPELANLRATPGSLSQKRLMEEENIARQTRRRLDDDRILLRNVTGGVVPKSIVQHLMDKERRGSPASVSCARKRTKSVSTPKIDKNQQKIDHMFRQRSASLAVAQEEVEEKKDREAKLEVKKVVLANRKKI